MKVIWSPLAVARLEEQAEFIGRDKPAAARNWAAAAFEAVESLAELPDRGRVVPEVGREEIRELLHGDYRILYRVEKEAVSILTIRHGRQLLDLQEVDR